VTFAVGAPLAEFMLWKSTAASAAVLDDAYEKSQSQHIRELREKVLAIAKVNLLLIVLTSLALLLHALPWFWGYFDYWYPLITGLALGSYFFLIIGLFPAKRGSSLETLVEDVVDVVHPPTHPSSIPSSDAHTM